jgi:predicted enzyme related to lactoylglutathione lyase
MAEEHRAGNVEIGIVVTDLDAAMTFYGETLGLLFIGEMELPNAVMKRYAHGDTVIKLLGGFEPKPAASVPGGMSAGIAGFRYLTLKVDDVEAMQQRCADAGYTVAVPMFEFRPGLHISIVEDPDGNWVELVPSSA